MVREIDPGFSLVDFTDARSRKKFVRPKHETAMTIRDTMQSPASSPCFNLTSFNLSLQLGCVALCRNACRRFATLYGGGCIFPRTDVRGYCISSRCDW